MLIGYARVSTTDQNLNRQLDAIIAAGVDKRNIYQEKLSGTKRNRPELDRMIAELQQGDTVIISELTRLSRSTQDLFEISQLIESKGANIKSLKESWLDTTTPHGRLLFTIFAGISQFERDLIADRTREGLASAKARGRVGGRPSKRNDKEDLVLMMVQAGKKIPEIVKATGLSRTSVYRCINANKEDCSEIYQRINESQD